MIGSRALAFAFLLPLPLVFTSSSSLAQDANGQWLSLEHDMSRADYFEKIKDADLSENPLTPEEEKSFELTGSFEFPADVASDRTVKPPKPRGSVLFGIDVSHHQGPDIRFDLLRQQGVRFVCVKATQGDRFKDPNFAENWASLAALPADKHLFRCAYHFLSAEIDAEKQAASYLNFIAARGGLSAADLPPVVDLEWDIRKKDEDDRWAKFTPDEILEKVLGWLKLIEEKTGRVPMIYTARSWWRERIKSEEEFSKLSRYKVWIADYSRSSQAIEVPKVPHKADWDLWQFTDSSKVSIGFDQKLDANIYRGTEAEFIADFQLVTQ